MCASPMALDIEPSSPPRHECQPPAPAMASSSGAIAGPIALRTTFFQHTASACETGFRWRRMRAVAVGAGRTGPGVGLCVKPAGSPLSGLGPGPPDVGLDSIATDGSTAVSCCAGLWDIEGAYAMRDRSPSIPVRPAVPRRVRR